MMCPTSCPCSHNSSQENAVWTAIATAAVLLLLPATALFAQEPRPPDSGPAIEAFAGNSAVQLRYLAPSPLAGTPSDLDYGFLLSDNRDIIGSAALLFRTNIHPLPHLSFEVGPQAYLALLAAQQKTDIFAVSVGANVRYLLLPRWGIAAFGSAFYSPSAITFGNADNLYDFVAGGDIRLTRRLTGLAGYRWLKFTTVGEPDVRVQNEVFAGLRWQME